MTWTDVVWGLGDGWFFPAFFIGSRGGALEGVLSVAREKFVEGGGEVVEGTGGGDAVLIV